LQTLHHAASAHLLPSQSALASCILLERHPDGQLVPQLLAWIELQFPIEVSVPRPLLQLAPSLTLNKCIFLEKKYFWPIINVLVQWIIG
jgi:hypothetical protein